MKERRSTNLFLAATPTVGPLTGCGSGGKTAETTATGQDTQTTQVPTNEASGNSTGGAGTIDLGTPLADVGVRQTLAYTIDMKAIVDSLFERKTKVAKGSTAPGDWLNPEILVYEYNPEKTKELLKGAGWPADYILGVVCYYDNQQTVDLMTIIGQCWQEIDAKAQSRKLESNPVAQPWIPPADKREGSSIVEWDLAYAAVTALVKSELYNCFTSTASDSSSVPKQDGLNEMIAVSSATMDIDEQKEAFLKVQQFVVENELAMPLYHQICFIYTSDGLGTTDNKFGNGQLPCGKNILDWEIDWADNTMYTNGGPGEFFQYPMVNPSYMINTESIFDKPINAGSFLNPTEGILAESCVVPEDDKPTGFILRDGLKWHDDEPSTAGDVKLTLELMLGTPGTNVAASEAMRAIQDLADFPRGKTDDLEDIEIDGGKATINFDTISASVSAVFSQWPILPKHYLEKASPEML